MRSATFTAFILSELAAFCALFATSCNYAPGYRDQAHYALQQSGERSGRKQQPLSADIVHLAEFLSAYRFDLPTQKGQPIMGRLIWGGTGTDREQGQGYLMVALSSPALSESDLPPRYWAIALDTSHSMGDGSRWSLATNAAKRLMARLRPQDRVSLLTFGDEMKVQVAWGDPSAASALLQRITDKPRYGDNAHAEGMMLLTRHLLDAEANGHRASGFFITEMEGAQQDLVTRTSEAREAGAEINVIGLAGGDETLLRAVARATEGSYIFLDDAGAIERNMGDRLSEIFDGAARDVRGITAGSARHVQPTERIHGSFSLRPPDGRTTCLTVARRVR